MPVRVCFDCCETCADAACNLGADNSGGCLLSRNELEQILWHCDTGAKAGETPKLHSVLVDSKVKILEERPMFFSGLRATKKLDLGNQMAYQSAAFLQRVLQPAQSTLCAYRRNHAKLNNLNSYIHQYLPSQLLDLDRQI